MRFDLSDEEWSVLEPLMPKSRKSARPHDRRIMNAIFYVLRTGIPWRDLPERYGPYTSAYNRFNRWSRRGVWKRIFDALAAKSRDSLYLIDSTIVKVHRAASGAKGGSEIRRLASAGEGDPQNPPGWTVARPAHYTTPTRGTGHRTASPQKKLKTPLDRRRSPPQTGLPTVKQRANRKRKKGPCRSPRTAATRSNRPI